MGEIGLDAPKRSEPRYGRAGVAVALVAVAGLALGMGGFALWQTPLLEPPPVAPAMVVTGPHAAAPSTGGPASAAAVPIRTAQPARSGASGDQSAAALGQHTASKGATAKTTRSYALNPTQLQALQQPPSTSQTSGMEDNLNFVLLGLDKLDGFNGNTDVIMVISIYPVEKRGLMFSIPRDLCVGSCESWSSRINFVFASKGPTALLETIESLTGMQIDRYVAVNFDGFSSMIDALGGVDVVAARDFAEQFFLPDGSAQMLNLNRGPNHLTGRQALMYARSRKFDAAGDFARICRQQQILAAVKVNVLTPGVLIRAPSLLREMRQAIVTNFTVGEMVALVRTIASIPSERFGSGVVLNDGSLSEPTRGEDGASLLRPDVTAIKGYVKELQEGRAPSPRAGCGEAISAVAAR